MRLFFTLIFSIILFNASAQTAASVKISVKGTVTDSLKNEPLGFVTITIKDAATGKPLASALSKDDGSFELLNLPAKAYLLTANSIGFKAKTLALSAPSTDRAVIETGNILLSQISTTMKDVTITASRPVIKQEVDRIGYDVQADPESKDQSVLDMMRKVPMLSVDANDNIKLKGNGNYKILINGKESALIAKNPSDVLKSMPAINIQKIEVITTPPAKYDAEGLSGIINILTKKNLDQGYNGTVNGRLNTIFGPGINVNGTVKQGNFGVSGFVGSASQGNQKTGFGSSQNFIANNSTLRQNGNRKQTGLYNYGDLELSYEIDSLNLLTGGVDFNYGDFDQTNSQLSTRGINGSVAQQYGQNNSITNHSTGFDGSINYEMGFRKNKDQLLTTSYKFGYSPNKQYTENTFFNTINFNQANFQQFNNSGNREHTVQVDYVQPFKNLNFEVGGKAIVRNNFSDFTSSVFNSASSKYEDDPLQSRSFHYNQDVYSIYNSYTAKLTKWTAKAGLRIERTMISADGGIDQSYNNLIPSVSVMRALRQSSISLGYTTRIQRPGIFQLNPFVDKTNPKFIFTGNPNLRPELNQTFELNYSNFSKGSVNAGLSYAFSNNSIQNVTYNSTIQNGSKLDTITTTTFQNLGSNKSLGINLNTNLVFIKKLNVSLNAQLTHIWLAGTYNQRYYTNDGFTGNAFINAGYRFNSGFRLGVNAGYYSGNVNLQGSDSHAIFSSYLLSKEFFKKKLILSLVSNNPYKRFNTFSSYANTSEFSQSSFNQNVYRTFAIRFNYKFGKLNKDIKKNQRGINNDDTKGGAKAAPAQ